jgi:serine/threonine-protein kinase
MFPDLSNPNGIAVDAAGDVYVRRHRQEAGRQAVGDHQRADVLPFTGLEAPTGVAVDAAGWCFM